MHTNCRYKKIVRINHRCEFFHIKIYIYIYYSLPSHFLGVWTCITETKAGVSAWASSKWLY
jgi:hypothetical protein